MLTELTVTQTFRRPLVHLAMFIALMFVLNQSATYAQEMHGKNSSPSYTGGKDALKEFIHNNLRYPDEAKKTGLSGTVEVKFIINHEGKVEGAQIMKGISAECDAEAIRLINLINGWSPGIRQGKPVNTFVLLPIEFKGPNKLHPARITGKIVEETTGLPLEGIFCIVKGTSIGSVSGSDGSYILQVPSDAEYLECFGVGYSLKEVEIDSHSTINIELAPEYVILE